MHDQPQPLSCLRMLAWKEFREWRWAFLLYVGLFLFSVIHDIVYLGNTLDPIPIYCIWCLLWGTFVPVLIGVRVSCSDASRNTLGFTAALPYSLQNISRMRLASGMLMVIGPPVIGALLLLGWLSIGMREQIPRMFMNYPHWILDFATGMVIQTSEQVALMLLVAVVGARRKSEAQVGAYGAIIGVCFFLVRILLMNIRQPQKWAYCVMPSTMMNQHEPGQYKARSQLFFVEQVGGPLTVYLVILAALAVWFTLRYGARIRHSTAAMESTWFGMRSMSQSIILPSSPLASLIWINLRQALPLMVAGWLMAIPMTMLIEVAENHKSWHRVDESFKEAMVAIGALWPAVIGAGLFASELRTNLGHFWRSRPISTRTWFWVKYVVGLAVVLFAVDVLPYLVANCLFVIRLLIAGLPVLHLFRFFGNLALVQLATLGLIHAACYTLAVLGVCWLRRPTLAAAMSLPILMTIEVTLDSTPQLEQYSATALARRMLQAYHEGSDFWGRNGLEYAITYGTIFFLTCLLAWAASRAARRNDVQELSSPLTSFWDRLWRKRTVTGLAAESGMARN